MTTPTGASLWTVVGLLAGVMGLVLEKVGGMAMPVVPPGLGLLLVAATLMLVTRLRWAPIAAVVAGAAELAGFFLSGTASWLTRGDDFVGVAGTWIRLAGITTAAIAGTVAIRNAYRKPISVR